MNRAIFNDFFEYFLFASRFFEGKPRRKKTKTHLNKKIKLSAQL